MNGGYSTELYETIAAFGLKRGASVLDLASETDDAASAFASNGLAVTRAPFTPALPFPDERFDVIISAQAFHTVDRTAALAEAARVLRPGGVIAIWWKHQAAQGHERAERPLQSGFREFYAADAFGDQTLRVLPWRTAGGTIMQYLYLARKH